MSISASIRGNIFVTDNLTGSVSLQKVLNNTYTGTVESYGQSVTIGTSSVTISLPINPVEFLYVKNLSTTASTNITVTWTPESGSSATVVTLDPGALIMYCEVGTSNGISALSLVSNQAGTPVEYVACG